MSAIPVTGMKAGLRFALLLALAAIASGCGTQKMYDGESRPPEAISRLRIADFRDRIAFKEIDDKAVGLFNSYSVDVLPGEHLIHLWQSHRICFGYLGCSNLESHKTCAKFRVTTRAGVRYEIGWGNKGLAMQDDQGNVIIRIDRWRRVPDSNATFGTPSDCS